MSSVISQKSGFRCKVQVVFGRCVDAVHLGSCLGPTLQQHLRGLDTSITSSQRSARSELHPHTEQKEFSSQTWVLQNTSLIWGEKEILHQHPDIHVVSLCIRNLFKTFLMFKNVTLFSFQGKAEISFFND